MSETYNSKVIRAALAIIAEHCPAFIFCAHTGIKKDQGTEFESQVWGIDKPEDLKELLEFSKKLSETLALDGAISHCKRDQPFKRN